MKPHHGSTTIWVKEPVFQTPKADGTLKEIYRTTPTDPTGREIYEATPPNPYVRGVVDQTKARESVLAPEAVMTVGCWNVRTL